MVERVNSFESNYRPYYRQVQFLDKDDTRSTEDRIRTLPVIRDEDLNEWKTWAEYENVSNNR